MDDPLWFDVACAPFTSNCRAKEHVIPGRAKGASPESITPAQGLWIPGSSLRSAPE